MKDEDYLVHNLNKIATNLEEQNKNLKFINWNLGKIVAFLTKDKKLNEKLDENKP